MLLKSIQSLAPLAASCKPPAPRPTARTASLYGSIESTISQDSATPLGDSLKTAPWLSSALACSRRKSLTTSLFPALIKLAAMVLPMPPVPMNPRVFISPPVIDLVFQSINRRAALPPATPLKQLFRRQRAAYARSAHPKTRCRPFHTRRFRRRSCLSEPNRTPRRYARASQTHPVKHRQRSGKAPARAH